MMKKINRMTIQAEEKNTLYNEGYRFFVEGDYAITNGTDPWSGMPNTTNNIYAFDNREDAEMFAVQQTWVFNPSVHAKVEELPPHTETLEERMEREAREKAERKAKREATEAKKAMEAGMTVKEYRAEKNRQARIKRVIKEIDRLERELAQKRAELKELGE